MEESIHEKKAMPGSFPADAGDLRHGVGRSCPDWNYDANYGILRGYNGAGGDVVVPGELDGFTVDVIGVSVFRGKPSPR